MRHKIKKKRERYLALPRLLVLTVVTALKTAEELTCWYDWNAKDVGLDFGNPAAERILW